MLLSWSCQGNRHQRPRDGCRSVGHPKSCCWVFRCRPMANVVFFLSNFDSISFFLQLTIMNMPTSLITRTKFNGGKKNIKNWPLRTSYNPSLSNYFLKAFESLFSLIAVISPMCHSPPPLCWLLWSISVCKAVRAVCNTAEKVSQPLWTQVIGSLKLQDPFMLWYAYFALLL